MKTKSKSRKLAFMALFLSLASVSLKAQCPIIETNFGCPIDVLIDIYDYINPPNGPCNTTVCNSYVTTVAANGSLSINCTGCTPVCNVSVTITGLNGSPVTPVPADFSTTSAIPVGASSPCVTSGSGWIKYDSGTNRFKIFQ